MFEFVNFGDPVMIQQIMESIELNAKNRCGCASFRHAVRSGNYVMVQLFLYFGANVNAQDESSGTLLHYAVERGYLDIFQRLLRVRDIDVNLRDEDGATPLIMAVSCRDRFMVRLLLNHGADTNVRDVYGQTSISIAISSRDTRMVRLLLANGVSSDVRCFNRSTYLHVATFGGVLEIIRLLLANGADPNIQDGYGRTSFNIAGLESKKVMSSFLKKRYKTFLLSLNRANSLCVNINEEVLSYCHPRPDAFLQNVYETTRKKQQLIRRKERGCGICCSIS